MFKAYASPPKAAEMEGKSINIDQILNFIDKNKENDKNFINIVLIRINKQMNNLNFITQI